MPLPPELERLLAAHLVFWRGMARGIPQQPIERILNTFPRPEHGHYYEVKTYRQGHGITIGDASATNDDQNMFNEGLLFTGKCEHFCYLMLDVVEKSVQDVFGVQAHARWLTCKAKPVWVLVAEGEDDVGLPQHSVLQITLPDGQQFIFDGTITQYGIPLHNWLVEKNIYLSRFTIQPLEEVPEHWHWRMDSITATSDNGYWKEAKERLHLWTDKPLPPEFCYVLEEDTKRILEDHASHFFREVFDYVNLT